MADWYITGDLAKVDEDGYFWFVGRADDIIKTSGHMVGPFEVETALMKHPAVQEAAVIGKPEPSIGEMVKAFIVVKEGFEPNDDLVLEILEERVNIWYTSPTAIRRLMRMKTVPREEFDLSALRMVLSVGEPLHPEEVLWGQQAFGVPVLDNWWQTETGGIMIANYPSMPVKPGSMGRPLPGIEARVAQVDGQMISFSEQTGTVGHLVLKKGFPSQFRTYLNEEERYRKSFLADWYVTGDLAKVDEDGFGSGSPAADSADSVPGYGLVVGAENHWPGYRDWETDRKSVV